MQLRVSIFFSNILFLNLLNVDRIALSKTKNDLQWSTTTHSNPQQSTKIQEKFLKIHNEQELSEKNPQQSTMAQDNPQESIKYNPQRPLVNQNI